MGAQCTKSSGALDSVVAKQTKLTVEAAKLFLDHKRTCASSGTDRWLNYRATNHFEEEIGKSYPQIRSFTFNHPCNVLSKYVYHYFIICT